MFTSMKSMLAVVLVLLVDEVNGACCPGAKVYAPKLNLTGGLRRLTEGSGQQEKITTTEESGQQEKTAVADGLLSKMAQLEDMMAEMLEVKEVGRSAPVPRATQSPECLNERALLTPWGSASPTHWEIQSGFEEHEFTRAVLDFFKLSESDYWKGPEDIVYAADNRVLAMRIDVSADLFTPTWDTIAAAEPTIVCESGVSTGLADLKSALANKSGYLALVVDASVKSTWDTWLSKSFPSVDSDCGSGCLVGVTASTEDMLSDVHSVLSGLNPAYLACEVCIEDVAGINDSLECCGESYVVAANYTPTHDIDYYGMYRRLEVEDDCVTMREPFTTAISVEATGDYYWYRGATTETFFTRFFYDFLKFPEYWTINGQIGGFSKVLVMNVDYSPKFIASYGVEDPHLSVDTTCQADTDWKASLLIEALQNESGYAVILTKPEFAAQWKFWAETEFAWLGAEYGCGTGCLLGTGVYEEGDLVGSVFKALSTIDGGQYGNCKPCLYTAPTPPSEPVASTTVAGDATEVSGMSVAVLMMLVHGMLIV